MPVRGRLWRGRRDRHVDVDKGSKRVVREFGSHATRRLSSEECGLGPLDGANGRAYDRVSSVHWPEGKCIE